MSTPSKISVQNALGQFPPIYSHYAWWVRSVEDDILRMEFGDPYLRIREPRPDADAVEGVLALNRARRLVIPTGIWSLFVADGLWTVNATGLSSSRGDKNATNLRRTLSQLDGQRLTDVQFIEEADEWIFKFDLAGELIIRSDASLPDAWQWTLFLKSGSRVSYYNKSDVRLTEASLQLGKIGQMPA